jgi:IS4 transposase
MLVKADQDVPCFTLITHATKNDKEILNKIKLPAGAIVVFDKGYNSYIQFEQWDKQNITWVTRMIDVAWQEQITVNNIDDKEKNAGVIADEKIRLGRPSNNPTPKIIVRKITFHDAVSGRTFSFITNNTRFKASTIAAIYKRRWQIELLFKRLKQNYPLRYFLGESENAIKIQIWCSLITDLLLKIISNKTKKRWSFANLSAMIRLHLMNYISVIRFLNNPEKALLNYREASTDFQLKLFT